MSVALPSPEEIERRLQRISEMRELILEARLSLREQRRQGLIPYAPKIDIRSDYDYWAKRRDDIAAGRLVLPSE